MKRIHIVAGVIYNADQDQIFITKRPDDKHKGGFWEFPGGKVESGESIEAALQRELNEELGIVVTKSGVFEHLDFDYVDKSLTFDFMLVTEFEGQPFGREGQQGQWVEISNIANYDFPEANRSIVQRVVDRYQQQ